MFHLAAAGYSGMAIVKLFRNEGTPPMGRSGRWLQNYVSLILADRRPLGEYQPRGRDDKPEGEPIANYFPPVITEKEWHAARAVLAPRRLPPTRITDHVNLFAGLLKDARNGEFGYSRLAAGKKRAHDVLVNNSHKEGIAPAITFPLRVFESAVLGLLAEIDPREVIGGVVAPDESAALVGEIAHVEAKIAELETALLEGDVVSIAKVLRQQETRLQELNARLAEARQKAAHPLAKSWNETQTLASILHEAEDMTDTRLRIRAALRRIVESIWLLIVVREGMQRLAAVQIFFTGGKRRDYLIHYRAAGRGRKGSAKVGSFELPSSDKRRAGKVDLRIKQHVETVAASLAKIPLTELASICSNVVDLGATRK